MFGFIHSVFCGICPQSSVFPSPVGFHGCGAVPRPRDWTMVRVSVRHWVTFGLSPVHGFTHEAAVNIHDRTRASWSACLVNCVISGQTAFRRGRAAPSLPERAGVPSSHPCRPRVVPFLLWPRKGCMGFPPDHSGAAHLPRPTGHLGVLSAACPVCCPHFIKVSVSFLLNKEFFSGLKTLQHFTKGRSPSALWPGSPEVFS